MYVCAGVCLRISVCALCMYVPMYVYVYYVNTVFVLVSAYQWMNLSHLQKFVKDAWHVNVNYAMVKNEVTIQYSRIQ